MSPSTPLTQAAAALGRTFRAVGFTADTIASHLGPAATDALYRGEPAAVRRKVLDDSKLSGLIRFFILRDAVDPKDAATLLGEDALNALRAAGAVEESEVGLRPLIDVRPHVIAGADRWIFSDVDSSMTEHVPGRDHVLGVGAASLSLLGSVPLTSVDTVLDLGTGSGVLALSQLGSAATVTATDVHPRALEFAAASAAASGADSDAALELLQGSWFEPVAGRKFDRLVANPPFVVGLPEVGHVYRDSGLVLDGASQLVVETSPQHLATGGTAHLLAAWIHTPHESWQQRVASWLPDTGVAAWVLQRDMVDPEHYVGTWLRDESLDPRSDEAQARTTEWLDYFAEHDVSGVGFGFVALHDIGDRPTEVTAEEITQPFTDPLGPEVEEYFARSAWLRDKTPDEIASSHFGLRPGVALENVQVADEDEGSGFTEAALRLTRTDGPRFSHDVDDAVATIVAGLNPDGLNLRETVELFALSRGLDEEELIDGAVTVAVDLIRHGFLIPRGLQ